MQYRLYCCSSLPIRSIQCVIRLLSSSNGEKALRHTSTENRTVKWHKNGLNRPLLPGKSNFEKRNIFLMGPPGSGKTTVGQELALLLNKPLIDIDNNWLEPRWKTTVASKLLELGDEQFLEAEGRELLAFNHENYIVSLTGSNSLHAESMEYISRLGIIVYLDASREAILNRCHKMRVNRIVGQRTKTLNDILALRENIYENSYDIRIIIGKDETQKDIAKKIQSQLQQQSKFYETTRNGYTKNNQQFLDTIQKGLASDGGLFVTRSFSPLALDELQRLVNLSYPEIALRIMERFPLGTFHPSHLRYLLSQAYSTFDKNTLPVRRLRKNQYLIETFHGPTASFKDLSLQLLPRLMQAATELTSNDETKSNRFGLLVATSGDTGCAVLDAFARLPGTPIVVLYPNTGVSTIQKAQMQTASNDVCVLGVDADFDFCQTMVKDLLNDKSFLADVNQLLPGLHLSSANSINWARFLPQVVFTISSYLQLIEQGVIRLGEQVDVCIPTGNFGNMLGAFYAQQLGLPLRRLITASNENNVITDFIQTGSYDLRNRLFHKTISPSIDILISSNLERFIYLLSKGNFSMVQKLFNKLARDRYFNIDSSLLKQIQSKIQGGWANENQCIEMIKKVYDETQQLIDPHTAVALHVADSFSKHDNVPMLISATAHYGKFPQTILNAVGSNEQSLSSSNDISTLLENLRTLKLTPPMHHELLNLPKKSVIHTKIVAATKSAIIKEIKTYLERFSKQQIPVFRY
ncbi:unnamed protein product [Rotaria socialis]|uniref:Threonine synthase n=1 Tax=Rotaria socialis TaxID=392032 RepID=A0A820GNZ5_9BILA|nr:unnamed protein product [Rotaria socialis]CAF3596964.1 unnamed protein product [Rotaria socialis]CAF4267362.1 unnamed protein product [Rotaria socialis]CAF4280216.1 unnamed protein product [Rotaria socialis]